MPPRPSSFKTVTLPNINAGGLAITIANAEDTAVRVVLRNDGASVGTARVAYDATELNTPDGTAFFPVGPGEIEIIVLAATQTLYAIAAGGSALFSIAQSDAFPITIKQPAAS